MVFVLDTSQNIIISSASHFPANVMISVLFVAEWKSIVFVFYILIIHLLTGVWSALRGAVDWREEEYCMQPTTYQFKRLSKYSFK